MPVISKGEHLDLTRGGGCRIIGLDAVAGFPEYSLQLAILVTQVDLPQPFCFDSDQASAACQLSGWNHHFETRISPARPRSQGDITA